MNSVRGVARQRIRLYIKSIDRSAHTSRMWLKWSWLSMEAFQRHFKSWFWNIRNGTRGTRKKRRPNTPLSPILRSSSHVLASYYIIGIDSIPSRSQQFEFPSVAFVGAYKCLALIRENNENCLLFSFHAHSLLSTLDLRINANTNIYISIYMKIIFA